jgi:hypothetical protein
MAFMETLDFNPPRQRGLLLHFSLGAVLLAVCGAGAWLATNEPIGLRFAVFIVISAAAFAPVPLMGYRFWALARASYRLNRDNLCLTWGMRVENIPVSDIEWVRLRSALGQPLSLPFQRLPGAILGSRRVAEIGTVEFMASEARELLLVATRRHVFAISPADPQGFLLAIQRAIEMGSLSPSQPQSVYPVFIIGEAWRHPLARYLWLAGLFINIGLLTWVSLMIPSLGRVTLGFLPNGAPGNLVPSVGLILLPILSIFLYALGWLAGLLFYRRSDQRPLALLLWGTSLTSSLLFLVAVMFIVTAAG